MEWWMVLLFIFGGLIVFMLSGMPVAFCFLFINAILGYVLWGGVTGLQQLIDNIFACIRHRGDAFFDLVQMHGGRRTDSVHLLSDLT